MTTARSEPRILELPADHPGRHRSGLPDEEGGDRRGRGGLPPARSRFPTSSTRLRKTRSGGSSPPSSPPSTETYACRAYLDSAKRLVLPADRVPQLREVDERLARLTGFHITPVAGLVPTRQFYGALADRTFHSTQYIRHHSVPFYTPEPDIVHEIIGHANMLAGDRFADLYEAAGKASLRATTEESLGFFSRVFWFSLEFGVALGGRRAARLRRRPALVLRRDRGLSVRRDPSLRSRRRWGRIDYDITRYQPVLFAAESFDRLIADLTAFFDGYDDEEYSRLAG